MGILFSLATTNSGSSCLIAAEYTTKLACLTISGLLPIKTAIPFF